MDLEEFINKLNLIYRKYGNIKDIQTICGKDDYIIKDILISNAGDEIYLKIDEI